MPTKALLLVPVLAGAIALGAAAAAPGDHALLALNILPPGEGQNLPELTSQLPLYDGLTLLRGKRHREWVVAGDVERGETRRAAQELQVEPTVLGGRPAGAELGVGPRLPVDVRNVLRVAVDHHARARALDADRFRAAEPERLGLVEARQVGGRDVASARTFVPSAATEAFLAQQATLAAKTSQGRQMLKDVDAYLLGINAYFKAAGGFVTPLTRNDVTAIGTLLGAVFGAGGGHEGRSAQFLSALQQRLGAAKGLGVWNDLRQQQDQETPVTASQAFPYENGPTGIGSGNVPIDAGSYVPVVASESPLVQRHVMSNALLIGAKRSANGHPIFVAGPQVGYFAPEILMEEDLRGGGLDARGVSFPGLGFYLQIGRGPDYAWSATSASSDVVDQFAETLCGGDAIHYMFKGQCVAMGTFDAGLLKGSNGAPDTELVYHTTVHGPVVAHATSNGTKVAISLDRSTRGRELLAALPFQALSTGAVHSPQDFFKTMSGFDLTFNWFYADSKHIAMYSSGRLPLRAPGVNGGLPTNGNGSYEWRGWLAPMSHAHVLDPPSGEIVNWNNKPAAAFAAADDNWSYGSVQRVLMLRKGIATKKVHTPASVVGAMNAAATQDLRATLVPLLAEAMAHGTAPSPRDAQLLQLLQSWDGSRLDANLDGKIDAAGAAIMDAWWPKLAVAVLQTQLGPLTDDLKQLATISDDANSQGSSYDAGWYSYVDKTLRMLLGKPVKSPYAALTCGKGDLSSCAAELWDSLDQAGNALAAAQGSDPTAWRSDATKERIAFAGFISDTMRWANRPTFQQVMVFGSHR